MDTHADIDSEIRGCQLCPLAATRTHAVPGEGPVPAEMMFIGEGPGYREDRQGRPFVGPAGEFLNAVLSEVGVDRGAIYITNVVKCRPPQNRDPAPLEVQTCVTHYLRRQIELVDPCLIVTLGRYSLAQFLPGASIARVHGQPARSGDRLIYPMLHPAAALHRPEWRELVQQDAAQLPDLLLQARALRTAPSPSDRSDDGDDDEDQPQQLSLF
jgi:uracil-DNA glycosylase family 4